VKILVTGAGGMLGSALIPALIRAGHDPWPTDLRGLAAGQWTLPERDLTMGQLDVRQPDEIARWVDRVEPDLVMHLAAETDVDLCEVQPDYARDTNALGTRHVARACVTAALPLVYISTAGVFDGQKEEPYNELDPAYPINIYGRSKLDGEEIVQTLLERFFIVRAGWMVGGGAKDHKFVAKIVEQVQAGATTVYAVDDKFGTPTYAPDFAGCLTHLMETDHYGLYHLACLGRGTRYSVAQVILEALGRTESVELVPVGSDFFQETYPAPRPRSEMMHNLMLERLGWNTMRPWEAAVKEYLLTAFPEACVAQRTLVTSL
jgi:dTDP-4-dehydrorhamnose reductase